MILQLVFTYFPAIVFGWLFVRNYRREPQQFRTALYFLAFCLFALTIIVVCVGAPLLVAVQAPILLIALALLVVREGSYATFTFAALLLYSWLSRRLPRHCCYDYIVVHGAGLSGTKLTPLLAGRLDKGMELWQAGGRRAGENSPAAGMTRPLWRFILRSSMRGFGICDCKMAAVAK